MKKGDYDSLHQWKVATGVRGVEPTLDETHFRNNIFWQMCLMCMQWKLLAEQLPPLAHPLRWNAYPDGFQSVDPRWSAAALDAAYGEFGW